MRTLPQKQRHASSFRDPSGFVFRDSEGILLRQVNACYADDYRRLMDSGLYADLVDTGSLIEHEEVDLERAESVDARYVIRPRELHFLSWAYEWSFSALKDAALLTLDIQRRAIAAGMWLKDASHFNIQFDGAQPVLIDTLSFERFEPGSPWPAYGQFCRHFLAPLALMAKTDVQLSRLLRLYLDGIPLDLASKLLPARTKWSLGLFTHIHLHAKFVRQYSDTSAPRSKQVARGKVSQRALLAIIDSLQRTIESLKWQPAGTEWADYYDEHSYSSTGFQAKQQLVDRFIRQVSPQSVWDLGANVGVFSRLAAAHGARTYAFDIDPACVERCYLQARDDAAGILFALWLDLSNPTPSVGWANRERASLLERGPADLIMALALIHHLAISNNVPLTNVAAMLAGLTTHLIIEFVPKGDPQVQRLLQSRQDIYSGYHRAGFEAAFSAHFEIVESVPVGDDGRIVYLMRQSPAKP
jgi:hypothetical protein